MNDNRIAPLPLLLLAACLGDVTASNGELGRLRYALHTDYEGNQEELTELPLITGYAHRISVSLTSKGEKEAGDQAGLVSHTARGVEGIEITNDESDKDSQDAPDFAVLSPVPGEVMVDSLLDGDTFDRIALQFESPTRLDVLGWSRSPWEEDWTSFENEALTVQEGSQISFLGVPMYKDIRLGGDFTPTITVDPPELAVPDTSVLAVQEGGMTTTGEPVTFYAIEPGTVTFTLSDPVNGVEATQIVEILPLAL